MSVAKVTEFVNSVVQRYCLHHPADTLESTTCVLKYKYYKDLITLRVLRCLFTFMESDQIKKWEFFQNVDYSEEIDISLEIEVNCPITFIEPKVLMNFFNNIGQLPQISMEKS